jgi:hypothetical protein
MCNVTLIDILLQLLLQWDCTRCYTLFVCVCACMCVCVCVAFVIQHAMRMCLIVTCGL